MTADSPILYQAMTERRLCAAFDVKCVAAGGDFLTGPACSLKLQYSALAGGLPVERRAMLEGASGGQGSPGVPFAPDYESLPRFQGVYRERQVDCAMALYGNMGIAREDREGRRRAELRTPELFDAPHVAFIGMERDFGATAALDVHTCNCRWP